MRSQSAVDFTSSLNHSDIRKVAEGTEPIPLGVRYRSFRCKEFEALDDREKPLTVTGDIEPGEGAGLQEYILIWPLFSRHLAHLDEIEIWATLGPKVPRIFGTTITDNRTHTIRLGRHDL